MKPSEVTNARGLIAKAKDATQLEQLRLRYLGKKGQVTLALHGIGKLPAPKRAAAGQSLNRAKHQLEQALGKRQQQLLDMQLAAELKPNFDLTAPGMGPQRGHLHPVEEIQRQLIQIFWQIGFTAVEGPEVETDWYNFEALNIPPDHPARDMQDTFYLENGAVVRTHTSNMQIRHMEANKPPIRIISIGKTYRNEDEDPTHLFAFRQIECLVVDEGIGVADLKGTILYMLKGLFGEDTKLRLRPNYFPYVEPALETDASCMICKQKDPHCRMCKGTGWIELGGSGMVHPQVLRNVGIDPTRYSGFAFGYGLERLTAIKHQVNDIRHFWRPNLKFLEQF